MSRSISKFSKKEDFKNNNFLLLVGNVTYSAIKTLTFFVDSRIIFEIPGQSSNDKLFVKLKISDLLGRETALLVDEEKEPGIYNVQFDASNFAEYIFIL